MKIHAFLPVLLLSLLLPGVQADTPDTAFQVASAVATTDGHDCGVRNETVCWAVEKTCIFVRIARHLIEGESVIPPPCTESANAVMLAFVGGETCSNYGIQVVVSLSENCKGGTCINEGILIVVGSFCGQGPVDACAGDVCVFSGCKPFIRCAPGSGSSLALQQTSASPCVVSYGGIVVVIWMPICMWTGVDALTESVLSSPPSDSTVLRVLTTGGCDVTPSLWSAIVCGKEEEVCSVMDSPECWAVRMICSFLVGPVSNVQDLFPHVDEPFCTTQPGCCASTTTHIETQAHDNGPVYYGCRGPGGVELGAWVGSGSPGCTCSGPISASPDGIGVRVGSAC